MGCWQSVVKIKSKRSDTTFDSSYVAVTPPTRGLSKRFWAGHVSEASSSGVSSAYSTPVRNTKTLRNRRVRRQLQPETPAIKRPAQPDFKHDLTYQNLPEFLKSVPLDIEGYEADFEEQRLERQKQITALQAVLSDNTAGYYTEESSSDCSSPLANGFVCTQNGNTEELESSSDSLNCDLNMEMKMMRKACGIMPKTSSPLYSRRNETFDVRAPASKEILQMKPPSASYQKWQKYLQTTPTYALHNITRIPEAIAGLFCPADFPAFTEVKALKASTPRQYQDNTYYEVCRVPNTPAPVGVNRPVAIQSTEL